MIQTRKVQYQCMSKLSPQELASRAHRFLSEGDRRLAGHQRNTNISLSSSNSGTSLNAIQYYVLDTCSLGNTECAKSGIQ